MMMRGLNALRFGAQNLQNERIVAECWRKERIRSCEAVMVEGKECWYEPRLEIPGSRTLHMSCSQADIFI